MSNIFFQCFRGGVSSVDLVILFIKLFYINWKIFQLLLLHVVSVMTTIHFILACRSYQQFWWCRGLTPLINEHEWMIGAMLPRLGSFYICTEYIHVSLPREIISVAMFFWCCGYMTGLSVQVDEEVSCTHSCPCLHDSPMDGQSMPIWVTWLQTWCCEPQQGG
jgi:hypothetical protein